MCKQRKVVLDFVNNRGQNKHVKFYIDKKTYEMLQDKSISPSYRQQYLIDEYHEYERERYYKRKHIILDLNKYFTTSNDSAHFKEFDMRQLKEAIEILPSRQKEIIIKVYFEGKTQIKIAKEINISKSTVSTTLKRALTNLSTFLKKLK